jgi:hypothetical protein
MSLKGNKKGKITALVLASLEGMEERVEARRVRRKRTSSRHAEVVAMYERRLRERNDRIANIAPEKQEELSSYIGKRQSPQEGLCS